MMFVPSLFLCFQSFAQGQRHANGSIAVILLRALEKDHDAVASEMAKVALMKGRDLRDDFTIAVKNLKHFDRLEILSEHREPAQVHEQHAHFGTMRFKALSNVHLKVAIDILAATIEQKKRRSQIEMEFSSETYNGTGRNAIHSLPVYEMGSIMAVCARRPNKK